MAFRLMTQLFNTTAWRRDPVLSILIDEAWKTIASANMADYIKYLYKTVRKYFGEAIVVTQEVDDIISSCAACANVSANAAGLAQLAQTSRQMPRDLRGLRKRLGKCRETCAACANASANTSRLARLAQTSRQMPRDLRDLRKRLGKYLETCAACANAKANAGRLAGVPANAPKVLRGTCNSVVGISKSVLVGLP